MFSMHPVLLCLCVVIVIGIVHNMFTPARTDVLADEARTHTVGVVLVAPPGEMVEPRILALMHAAVRPNYVRFYVAKVCSKAEDEPAIQNPRLRVNTRIHYIREGYVTDAHLRARLIPDVMEYHVLVLDWPHQIEMGWDNAMVSDLQSCRRGAVALSSRLPVSGAKSGFLTVEEHAVHSTRIGWSPFVEQPKRPLPSIAFSANFLFARTHDVSSAWPSAEALQDNDEDATVTASLWMCGVDAFAPAHMPVWLAPGVKPSTKSSSSMHTPRSGTTRSRGELLTHLGIRNGRVTSRARSGLTQAATAQERFAKLGQTFTTHRDI